MKKLQIPCAMQGGGSVVIDFFVFAPNSDYNPIYHQSAFYAKKGIVTPKDVMDNLRDLYTIAKQNDLDFMEVLDYVFKSIDVINR